jgi:mannonate dehydratase
VLVTQMMRWFGPHDPAPLAHIRQAGASEVVTALHEMPNGAIWAREDIAAKKALIAQASLGWTVVESLPGHEEIKTRGPQWERTIDAYCRTLANLGACGIKVVTYNFMPLLDWTRTDLAWELPNGARTLRFDRMQEIFEFKQKNTPPDETRRVWTRGVPW